MRKWHWIAGIALALGAAGGYRYFTAKLPVPITNSDDPHQAAVKDRREGQTEESEAIEPIIVDRGRANIEKIPPGVDEGPMPRVLLEPGMKQPPRPDAESVRKMPYADE